MGGFDFNKCKVNLKLALNRMKIQKSKKQNEIKASRKSIADLLRSGKEEIARVKVEAVIRDDMMLQAFEILDLFVELLLSRIELIKMQTGCPFDLKEAVCTIIYAAPRIDAKELLEVRSQFIEKYGKPFASEAMENKGCCVNAKLILKMSVVTPDNAQVFEYLGSIAKEHGVDWVSPLSAAPDEIGMFPPPPHMAQPLQPQLQAFPATPGYILPPGAQPVLPGAAYSQQANIAMHFPSVPPPNNNNNNNNNNMMMQYGAGVQMSSPPPPYPPAYGGYPPSQQQQPPPQHHQFPPAPPAAAAAMPPSYPTPGNPSGDVPGIDDLMARFNNLKNN